MLLSLLVYRFTGVDLDAYCGLAVALFILAAGVRSAKETISPLLGQKPDPELVKRIESIVLSHAQVTGLHDLVVHDYGPGRLMISLHAEVSATADIRETHDAIDNIERRLADEAGLHRRDSHGPRRRRRRTHPALKAQVTAVLADMDARLSLHDFRVVTGPTHTNVIFDLVVPTTSARAMRSRAGRPGTHRNGRRHAVRRYQRGSGVYLSAFWRKSPCQNGCFVLKYCR